MDYAEKDINLILNRLSSNGGSADVADLFEIDGIEKLRIYPLIYRLREKGSLEIVEFDEMGAPVKVRLKK